MPPWSAATSCQRRGKGDLGGRLAAAASSVGGEPRRRPVMPLSVPTCARSAAATIDSLTDSIRAIARSTSAMSLPVTEPGDGLGSSLSRTACTSAIPVATGMGLGVCVDAVMLMAGNLFERSYGEVVLRRSVDSPAHPGSLWTTRRLSRFGGQPVPRPRRVAGGRAVDPQRGPHRRAATGTPEAEGRASATGPSSLSPGPPTGPPAGNRAAAASHRAPRRI